MISNNNYEYVNATFEGLQELIKSNGTYLFHENLKIQIENLSDQFQLKKELQITFCIICDNLDNKSTLIDALLKEKISDHLRSDHQYLVKSDPSIQNTIIDDENQKLCSITVEKERLKLLNNSNIVLSFEKYSQFMEDIQIKNAYKPDVVILVINSPKDLQKNNIQSFFNSIKGQFNDENFFFVLNEGLDIDCTATNICDVCYPSNIRYLFSDHKLENRGFKISTSRCLNVQSQGNSDVLDENYENLLKTLENELDINHVLNRFKQQADKIKMEIDSVLQAFKVEDLRASINEYNNKLNEKAPIILNKIETHKSKSIEGVNEMFKNIKIKNRKSKFKTFLEENSKDLYKNLQNDILKLTEEISKKDCNKPIGTLSTNIMHEHGLKEENIKNKSYELFDEYIDKQYPQNVVEESVNEEKNNEMFIKSTIEITKGIFGYAKDRFLSFKSSFENKATSIVIRMETRINQAIRNVKFYSDFEKFKINLRNRTKQNEENLLYSIKSILRKYDQKNLFEENNLKSELISTINRETNKMRKIEDEIKIFLASSCMFSNENCEDYFKNYFPKTDFENFLERYKNKIDNYNQTIQDDKYYNVDITIPGEAIGAVSGAATGALITAPIPILIPFGAIVGGVFGSILGRGKNVEIKKKFLKSTIVLKELESLKGDLAIERDKIIEILLTSLKTFILNY